MLIFGDSFFLAAIPLIRPLFSEILYVRSDVYKPELVYLFDANIVITSNAERYLSKVKPDRETNFMFYDDIHKDFYKEKPSKEFINAVQSMLSIRYDRASRKAFLNNLKASVYNDMHSYFINQSRSVQANNIMHGLCRLKPKNKVFKDRLVDGAIDLSKVENLPISFRNIQSYATFVFKLNLRKSDVRVSDIVEINCLDSYGLDLLHILIENINRLFHLEKMDESECRVAYANLVILSHQLEQEEAIIALIENYSSSALNRLYALFKASYLFNAAGLLFARLKYDYFSENISDYNGLLAHYYSYLNMPGKPKGLNNLDSTPVLIESLVDQKFADYLFDKSVAIVGPAPTHNNYGAEIDGFDVVIRLSFISNEKSIPDPERIGKKVNVSYFSAHLRFFEAEISSIVNNVDFVCITLPKYTPDILSYGNVRQAKIVDACFIGKPNLIQSTVLEVLHFKPSKVKVFCSNLFVSENTYSPAYPSTDMLNKVANNNPHRGLNSITFTNHDPINNFLILKILYENKQIDCDPELAEVLDMSMDGYMSALDNIYG